MNIITTYKGVDIHLEDGSGKFYCNPPGADNTIFNEKLSGLKDMIDRRAKKKFKQIPVFFQDGYGHSGAFTKGKLTSVTDRGSAWILSEGGVRSKVYSSNVFQDTKANRELIKGIERCSTELETLEGRRDSLQDRLKGVDIEKLRVL